LSAKNKKNDLSVYKKEETYQGLRNLQKNRCFTRDSFNLFLKKVKKTTKNNEDGKCAIMTHMAYHSLIAQNIDKSDQILPFLIKECVKKYIHQCEQEAITEQIETKNYLASYIEQTATKISNSFNSYQMEAFVYSGESKHVFNSCGNDMQCIDNDLNSKLKTSPQLTQHLSKQLKCENNDYEKQLKELKIQIVQYIPLKQRKDICLTLNTLLEWLLTYLTDWNAKYVRENTKILTDLGGMSLTILKIQECFKKIHSLQEEKQTNGTQNSQSTQEDLLKTFTSHDVDIKEIFSEYLIPKIQSKSKKKQDIKKKKQMMEHADRFIQWLYLLDDTSCRDSNPCINDIKKYKEHIIKLEGAINVRNAWIMGTFIHSVLPPQGVYPIGLVIIGAFIPTLQEQRPSMWSDIIEELSHDSNISKNKVKYMMDQFMNRCKQQHGSLDGSHRDVEQVETLCRKYVENYSQDIQDILQLFPSLAKAYETWNSEPHTKKASSPFQQNTMMFGEKMQVLIKKMDLSEETNKQLSKTLFRINIYDRCPVIGRQRIRLRDFRPVEELQNS